MTGDELEKALSRYRIGDPPPGLRARILETTTPDPVSALPVWFAIGAVAACTILFLGGASAVYGTLRQATIDAQGRDHDEQIASTADAIGGSALGLEQAATAVMAAESDAATTTVGAGPQ
jgi:hypothetical protein